MKTWVFWLLFLFASSKAQECFEEKADSCVDMLLEAVLGDSTKEEACRELEGAVKCMREAADQCGNEVESEVEEGLAELDKLLKDNCEVGKSDTEANDDEDDVEYAEIHKCLETNEDYIYECMLEGTEKTLEHVLEQNIKDENYIKCALFGEIATCFVRRVDEKCGKEAARMVGKGFSEDIPVEVVEACQKAYNFEENDIKLLEDLKKKK